MAASGVNLDALIPREDLAVGEGLITGAQGGLKVELIHLRDKFWAGQLRKPEFQRETVQWSPNKIFELIEAFLDRQLIPAIILWHAGQLNFVVDGAHRLSAILAWIYDDYGDGERSRKLFGQSIPPEQLVFAEKARKLVERRIGKFTRFEAGLDHPDVVTESQRVRIGNMSIVHFTAQWVPSVTAQAAEDSFFKINDAATPLDATEKRILQSRGSASSIASRAISHGGKGYKYWGHFSPEICGLIEENSARIFSLLYKPPLSDGPIDTLDVPVAGRGYSVLPFVFDLVNAINNPKVADSTSKGVKGKLLPDQGGSQTLDYLRNTLKVLQRITGKEPSSLGLHPVVYFFTKGGSFSPWAFLAWVKIISSVFERGQVNAFCGARKKLEEYLLEHKWAMTEIIHKNGSGFRSTPWLERYWQFVLDQFVSGASSEDVVASVLHQPGFRFLEIKTISYRLPGENSERKIDSVVRTSAIWDAALPGAPRCTYCDSRYHRNSIHGDHIIAKRDGGDGRPKNVTITHPYCDSTYKDWLSAQNAAGGNL